jgi:hypothetical protein
MGWTILGVYFYVSAKASEEKSGLMVMDSKLASCCLHNWFQVLLLFTE